MDRTTGYSNGLSILIIWVVLMVAVWATILPHFASIWWEDFKAKWTAFWRG